MVLEYSPEMSSSSAEGWSPFLKPAMVGSDNSSFTQGSSTIKVAGKKRLPTMQCALAGEEIARASRIAMTILTKVSRYMTSSKQHWRLSTPVKTVLVQLTSISRASSWLIGTRLLLWLRRKGEDRDFAARVLENRQRYLPRRPARHLLLQSSA